MNRNSNEIEIEMNSNKKECQWLSHYDKPQTIEIIVC